MDIDLAQVELCLQKTPVVLARDEGCQILLAERVETLETEQSKLKKAIDEQLQQIFGLPFCEDEEGSNDSSINCIDGKFLLDAQKDYSTRVTATQTLYDTRSKVLSAARAQFNSYLKEYNHIRNQVCARVSPGIDQTCINRKADAQRYYDDYQHNLDNAQNEADAATAQLAALEQSKEASFFANMASFKDFSQKKQAATSLLSSIESITQIADDSIDNVAIVEDEEYRLEL